MKSKHFIDKIVKKNTWNMKEMSMWTNIFDTMLLCRIYCSMWYVSYHLLRHWHLEYTSYRIYVYSDHHFSLLIERIPNKHTPFRTGGVKNRRQLTLFSVTSSVTNITRYVITSKPNVRKLTKWLTYQCLTFTRDKIQTKCSLHLN